jgi:metal-dependent amidase/aminoacylase/carboxypeptidase family protein
VVNDATSVGLLRAGTDAALGPDASDDTEQSLGGEDFAWYLHQVPGAMARLGTRTPGTQTTGDLHQPTFDVDERAIGAGIRVLSVLAAQGAGPGEQAVLSGQ